MNVAGSVNEPVALYFVVPVPPYLVRPFTITVAPLVLTFGLPQGSSELVFFRTWTSWSEKPRFLLPRVSG